MFSQNGLSLDQAPPIWVVFRFFLVASMFGIAGGVALAAWGGSIFDFSSPHALVVTHIFTLGVMLSFMLGALFQMLPVIAGVTLKNPTLHAYMVQIPLVGGIFALLYGFMSGQSVTFITSGILLGYSLFYATVLMISRLSKIDNHSASSRGMMFALLSLMVVVLLGLYMNSVHAGLSDGLYFAQAKQVHYSYGLFGWIALLVISISFQVVEMFYVTPAYPKSVSRWMPAWITALLVLLIISVLFYAPAVHIVEIVLWLSIGGFGILTLIKLSQRKRPVVDASLWFWRIGMSSLIVSVMMLVGNLYMHSEITSRLIVVLYASFATSVVFAMFYKIVPFLTWFHLNSQGYLMAPMMHEIIHPKVAKKHLWIHASAIVLLLGGVFIPILIYLAGVAIAISFGWAGYQIIKASRLYIHTQNTQEKFDFGAPSS